MKYYNFSEDFDDKHINEFIDWININQAGDVTIFLTSSGGYSSSMGAMKAVINDSPDRFTLVADSYIESAAFELFFKVKCKRILTPGTWGMYHLYRKKFSIMANGRVCRDERWVDASMKSLKHELSDVKSFLSTLELTSIEYNEIVSGRSVYFDSKRLNQIFKRHSKKYGKVNTAV